VAIGNTDNAKIFGPARSRGPVARGGEAEDRFTIAPATSRPPYRPPVIGASRAWSARNRVEVLAQLRDLPSRRPAGTAHTPAGRSGPVAVIMPSALNLGHGPFGSANGYTRRSKKAEGLDRPSETTPRWRSTASRRTTGPGARGTVA